MFFSKCLSLTACVSTVLLVFPVLLSHSMIPDLEVLFLQLWPKNLHSIHQACALPQLFTLVLIRSFSLSVKAVWYLSASFILTLPTCLSAVDPPLCVSSAQSPKVSISRTCLSNYLNYLNRPLLLGVPRLHRYYKFPGLMFNLKILVQSLVWLSEALKLLWKAQSYGPHSHQIPIQWSNFAEFGGMEVLPQIC